MGYMHRIRKGIRQSINFATERIMNDDMEQEPPLEPAHGNLDRKHYIGINAINFYDIKVIISTDLPRRLPIISERGNTYIFVMYNFASNIILAVPIKNITKQSLIQGYKYFLIDLTRAVIKPILHRLDNEVSEILLGI